MWGAGVKGEGEWGGRDEGGWVEGVRVDTRLSVMVNTFFHVVGVKMDPIACVQLVLTMTLLCRRWSQTIGYSS